MIRTPPLNLDADFHFVLTAYGNASPSFDETDPAQATSGHIIQRIYSGEWETVLAVIVANPEERHSRDVTEDVARQLQTLSWRDEEEPCESVRKLLDRYRLDYPTSDTRWDDGPNPAALDSLTQGVDRAA